MALRITDLPPASRPRERLLRDGAAGLTDVELVALLLGHGRRGCNALQLAQQLIAAHGGLHALLHADVDALRGQSGLGPAKVAQLAAVLELARRALAEPLAGRPPLQSTRQTADYLRLWLGGEAVEVFAALWLDSAHKLVSAQQISRGTLGHTSVYPRELVKLALAHRAAAVILAHNHPSGAALPSASDRLLTQQLQAALALVEVRLLDHCIVTRDQIYSFAAAGLL